MEMQIHSTATAGYQIQTRTFQGKKYLVVPVIMMVEGVHDGSAGPLLHTAEDLGKAAHTWNGHPITIGHPEQNGRYVSANSPEQLEHAVGQVFNTRVEDGRLRGEAWLDEQKLLAVSPVALAYIRQGRQLEVSIGVFTEDEPAEGDWNGEQYVAIARNHRPDHLALLPGERGACSWEDGCGIRANKQDQVITLNNKDDEMKPNEDTTGTVTTEEIIPEETTTMKRTKSPNINSNNEKEVNMNETKLPCGNCMEKVVALINNERTHFTKADREWLMEQDETTLDKLVPKDPEPVQVNREQALEVLKDELSNADKAVEILSGEAKDRVEAGLKSYNEKRTDLIQRILANNKDVWTEDELKEQKSEILEKIAKGIKAPADYSVNGEATPPKTSNSGGMLLPNGVTKTEK